VSRTLRIPTLAAMLAVAALTMLAAPTPAAAQPGPCPGQTTVRDGDTLVAIAARCGVTVPALLAANPRVRADEDLVIGRSIEVPPPGGPQPRPQQVCGEFYTIRSGDTLAGIALKCGLTVPLLVAVNGPLPSLLSVNVGGRIRIPDVPRSAVRDTLTWVAPLPAELPEAEVAPEPEELVRAEGTLAPGTPCLLLRTGDGRTIALAGERSRAFRTGDRVAVMGVPAPADRCGHSPALEIRIMYRADP
jgi:LysM repeat protein